MGGFFNRFLYGRHGNDALNIAIIGLWIALSIVNMFVHSLVIYVLELVCMVLFFVRLLSRNLAARKKENDKFLSLTAGLRGWIQNLRVRRSERKYFAYFKCPQCHATLRMPKRTGTFNVTCTKCGCKFQKKLK